MELKDANKLLSDFSTIRNGKYETRGEDEDDELVFYEVYKIKDELFVEFKLTEDSYGGDERVLGLKFVKPTKKSITSYEPV